MTCRAHSIGERYPSVRPRAQCINDQGSIVARSGAKEDIPENNYCGGLPGGRPFATTNSSLASATRLINHHLFGSSVTGPRHYTGHRRQISGTSTESKLSLSADSIDSEGVPFIDRHHRISKSILKKSESSSNYYSNTGDSDTEKLITDNASTISMCDNDTSTCDVFIGNVNGMRLKQPVSPLLSKQVLESIFCTNNNLRKENEVDQAEERNSVSKFSKSIFDDVLEEGRHMQDESMMENNNRGIEGGGMEREGKKPKDNQTMLICSLRAHKPKKLSGEEKRKVKTSGHSCKATDTNCLPQEHRFSS
ncbi:hypothetical protein ANTRET_LOCUS2123 [Anthophora retusa]